MMIWKEMRMGLLVSGIAWSLYILCIHGIQELLAQAPSTSLTVILLLWLGGLGITMIVMAVIQLFRRKKYNWLISLLVNLVIIGTISISLGSVQKEVQAHPPNLHPQKEVIVEEGSGKVISKTITQGSAHIRYDFLPNYLIIIVIVHTVVAVDELKQEKVKQSELAAKLSQATLEALRAKLNPHFMFNALNTVSALMEEDTKEAQRVLEDFSFLLRNMVDKSSEQFSSLEEEIHFLKTYAAIEKKRFGQQLEVHFSVEEKALAGSLPSLILQPLLENAIKHGRNKSNNHIHIILTAKKEESRLCVDLSDEGEGFIKGEHPTGAGLAITKARLKHLYGKDAQFSIRKKPSGGTIVHLNLPFDHQ